MLDGGWEMMLWGIVKVVVGIVVFLIVLLFVVLFVVFVFIGNWIVK